MNNPYKSTYNFTGSLSIGSYIDPTEFAMFNNGSGVDVWYGYSPNDVIELSVFDREFNFLSWNTINQDKEFKTVTLSYNNNLNNPVKYSYDELQTDFILYKNEKILPNVVSDLSSSFEIVSGSYVVSYNFVREMAGSPNSPLIIKDISPSRKEIKLIPYVSSSLSYESFCRKDVLTSDISSLLITTAYNCPFDNIYTSISSKYKSEINTLKFIFFLNTDGEMITFLKNMYEDKYTYSNVTIADEFGNDVTVSTNIDRRQGIRSYFSNYLLTTNNSISNFSTIKNAYSNFTLNLISSVFSSFGTNLSSDIVNAQKFIYDFFTENFYYNISDALETAFYTKYYGYLKNCLNFGNNQLLPILNTSFIDERISATDPLTLLIKLQTELPSDFQIKTTCWVTNTSITPFIFGSIVKSGKEIKTFKIGSPNFSVEFKDISLSNSNTSYTANDFINTDEETNNLVVSKNLTNLNVNYTNFQNFIVFSSAELRVKVFQSKINNYYSLSSSLSVLNNLNSSFLISSGSMYPYYTEESNALTENISNVFTSFDGYESYLYKSGGFTKVNGQFISSSYISDLQFSASYYDQANKDSLINNCPKHVLEDENNDDYLIFLGMIGHFFDEIYSYISQIPSQKTIGNSSTEEFTRRVVDYMLETFGWKLDDTLDDSSLVKNYLDDTQGTNLDRLSSEERLKVIRNRILSNLPQIYKTKGTEESIRLLLSCYGIPSSLLSIREFGGINYGESTKVYSTYEKVCMKHWSDSSKYDYLKIGLPNSSKTILFKIRFSGNYEYDPTYEQSIVGSVTEGVSKTNISGSGEWAIGFIKSVKPTLGKLFFRIGYKGFESLKLYSPEFPLFDGSVYSVMVRRNTPDDLYEYSSTIDAIPCTYDLYIQRNITGKEFIRVTSSSAVYDYDTNHRFNGVSSSLLIGGWFADHNQNTFVGDLDKLQIWHDPVTDAGFSDYVDNMNSYANSGLTVPHQSLLIRMHTDYPLNLSNSIWKNGNDFYTTGSVINQVNYLSITNPISTDYFTSFNSWKGHQDLVYDSSSCLYISQSAYPYQFSVFEYQNTYKISKYGPNKLKNEKFAHANTTVLTRLDNMSTSTFIENVELTPDSNQVGLFIDPQDFKNKDIIRYFGNYDFMNEIGDPRNQFSSSYSSLKSFRTLYEKSKMNYSGSRVLYNELITLYKFYFNKSIFESVKNLLPSRTNTLTGIVIEPSVLERPKYQHKPIDVHSNPESAWYTETVLARYSQDPNTKLVRMSQSIDYANFDVNEQYASSFDYTTLPSNTNAVIDLTYINNTNHNLPEFNIPQGTYFPNCMDNYQFGHFGSSPYIHMGDNTLGKLPFDMLYSTHPSGSQKYYMLKRWTNYTSYFINDNEYSNRTAIINSYSTSSCYVYDYIVVTEEFYKDVIYTETISNDDAASTTIEDGTGKYIHYANTFKNTDNKTTNNTINPTSNQYLEIAFGYPRNHRIYKPDSFSLFRVGTYTKNKQTINTTVGEEGLSNQTAPVEVISVSNINLLTPSQNVINA